MGIVKGFFELNEFSRRVKGRPETMFALIRNQQARGSTPRAGSSEIKGLAIMANPIFVPG
jgi:hypothetical protein